MRRTFPILCGALLLAGCGGSAAPSASPKTSAAPRETRPDLSSAASTSTAPSSARQTLPGFVASVNGICREAKQQAAEIVLANVARDRQRYDARALARFHATERRLAAVPAPPSAAARWRQLLAAWTPIAEDLIATRPQARLGASRSAALRSRLDAAAGQLGLKECARL